MNKDQGSGIIERAIYGLALMICMKFVAAGYLDPDMAPYIAGGVVTLVGGGWAWWHNRPVSVLNRAAAAVPDSAQLVIQMSAAAPRADRQEAARLAVDTVDKVTAHTS